MYYAPRVHGRAARAFQKIRFGSLLVASLPVLAGCDASPAAVAAEELPSSIQLSKSAVEFATADTTRLQAVLLGASGRPIASPSAGQSKSASTGFRWESSDRQVVDVSRSGLLQARGSGEATVTASSGNLRAQAQVQVKGNQRTVVVSPKVDTLTHLGDINQLNATLFDGSGKRVGGNVSWTSSNPRVVTVDGKGTITALAVGVALVTATASSSADTARVVVRQEPAAIEVSPGTVTAIVGETTTFRANVVDAGGTEIPNTSINWTSSDTRVATVDGKGVVSAKAAGTAIIRAAAEDATGSGGYTVKSSSTDSSPPPAPSAPPPSSGTSDDHPNEPSGFRVITDQPWDLPPWHRDNAWNGRDDTSLTIVEDSWAPRSARRVARAQTFVGMDGVGTHSTSYYFTSEQRTQELYFAVWQMFPSTWINHRTGTKQLWPGIHGHPNSVYSSFANQEMRIQVNLQGQAWGNRNLNPNLGPSSHHNLERWRDQWYRLEFYLKMNTVNDRNGDQSRANGIVRVWMTAGGETHLILNYEDVKFLAIDRDGNYVPSYGSTSDGTFHTFKWNPTYGGTGDPAPAVMYNYTDHIYVSGAR